MSNLFSTIPNTCAVFVASRAYALVNSRTRLIKYLKNNDWQVITISNADKHTSDLIKLGVIVESLNVKRGGIKFLSDFFTLIRLNQLYRKYNPALIHHFHAKPVILGNLAVKKNDPVQIINTITGLGHAFTDSSYVQHAALLGYKIALKKSAMTIFQNRANQELFLKHDLVKQEKTRLIISSGVDVQKYTPKNRRSSSSQKIIKILFASRLLKSKGVYEFLQAAKMLKSKHDNVSFQLAGEWDLNHPDSVDPEEISAAQESGYIHFLGYVDLSKQLKEADIFVYPSFYSEGIARVLLEASATGIPVITTNISGCREAVENGKTGLLVEPQNLKDLVRATDELIQSPSKRDVMGKAGRIFTINNFDIERITEAYLNVYRELGIEI